jgi:hypothetical protein
MGLPCFASFGYASGLTMYHHGFACGGWLHLYTSSTTHWRGCPPASPHRLTTIGLGPALTNVSPKGSEGQGGKHHRFAMGVLMRVREYQPVVHRLRLSASP